MAEALPMNSPALTRPPRLSGTPRASIMGCSSGPMETIAIATRN
jgi:hypothetical protein